MYAFRQRVTETTLAIVTYSKLIGLFVNKKCVREVVAPVIVRT